MWWSISTGIEYVLDRILVSFVSDIPLFSITMKLASSLCLIASLLFSNHFFSQDYTTVTLLDGTPSPLGLYDFDGDGDLDLLCKNYDQSLGSMIWWIENTGNNLFQTIHHTMSSYESASALVDNMTVEDLDNDGDLDIFFLSGWSTGPFSINYGKLYYYQNDGLGNFYPYSSATNYHSYCFADLNNDGEKEIYATFNLQLFQIFFNGSELTATPIFTATNNGFGDRLIELKSADINGDNQPDLVYILKDILYGDNSRDYIEAILNTNSTNWTATQLMSGQTGNNANYDFEDLYYFELVDVDNDADLDLQFNGIADNGFGNNNNSLNIKLNNGNGTFGNFCDTPDNGFGFTSSHNLIYDFDSNNIPDFLCIDTDSSWPPLVYQLYQNYGCSIGGTTTEGYMPFAMDYNNDGNLDLFKSIYVEDPETFIDHLDQVQVFYGDGSGNFTQSSVPFDINSPTNQSYDAGYPAADFDNNGSVDLINIDNYDFQQINTNVNGLAMKQTNGTYPANTSGQFWKCAHMNNNNFIDLVFIASDAGTANQQRDIYIKPNINGQLTGTAILAFDNTTNPTNSYTRGFNIADTDNDGDQDLLVYYKKLSQNDGKIYLIRNQGNFSFAAAVALTPSFGQDYDAELVVLDYDNDGDKDLFMFGKFFRNNGNNNFTEQYTTAITCADCEFSDVDLDGDLDVMSKNVNNYFQTFLYINQGNFTFTNTQTFDLGSNGTGIFRYDFDGDGLDEFISEDVLLKKFSASDANFTIIGEIAPIQRISTIADGRTVTWIAGDGYDVNEISYDFIDGVYCFGIVPSITEINDELSVTPVGADYQWYDCSNNAALSGANGAQLSPNAQGSYRVEYTYGNCALVSACVEVVFMPGDFDSDNIVNVNDLLLLLQNFGCSGDDCMGDLDNNGTVGSTDIMILLGLLTE
jgi:hypothetical protein